MFFSDLLTALHVPHTDAYSQRRFMSMPFMSMFGMKGLLAEYGVAAQGVSLADKSEIALVPTPFVAPVKAREWVIVTDVGDGKVRYLSQGVAETADVDMFNAAWTGVAMVFGTDCQSREPDYCKHRFAEIMTVVRNVALWVCLGALALIGFVAGGLWRHPWAYALVVLDVLGLAASFMLVQKTAGIHTRAAENVCAAIERGGCDTVINTGGTFLGIFHWSEVGLAYFSVSLVALLAVPATALPWLALINVLCLPYTVWSVCYQHFKIHAWCTLCLTVQGTLWLLFIAYLSTGWWHQLTWSLMPVVLVLCYVTVCVALNRLLPLITRNDKQP